MNINDIMMRDIMESEKRTRAERERQEAARAYDREVSRRLWKRRLRACGEIVGAVALLALFALLFWLFLIATPDQMSAECDWARQEMEAAETEVR